jgi:hypothetical protein
MVTELLIPSLALACQVCGSVLLSRVHCHLPFRITVKSLEKWPDRSRFKY